MPKSKTKQIGNRGENLAAEHLAFQGFRIVARNYYYDHCETDIIAEDGKHLLFAEVKTRVYSGGGELSRRRPCLAVTPVKAENMRRSAAGFLREFPDVAAGLFPRFEVIEVMITGNGVEIRRVHMIE